MSNANTPASPTSPTLEQWMRSRHGSIGVVLLVCAALFAALPIWQLIAELRDKHSNTPLGIWGLGMALVLMFGGIYLTLTGPGAGVDERYRLLVLGMGGVAGLLTFLLGVFLPVGPDPLGPWASSFVPMAESSGASGVKLWRENWWRIAVCALAVLGGLSMMFASLQLARSVERASAGMRRLLYGYNAALTGLLLFAILGLANVLSYVQLPPFSLMDEQLDWTPSQIYTLSNASRELLKNEVPGSVEVYSLMPFSGRIQDDMETLVKNCKHYKKDIELKSLSPDVNPAEFQKTARKYGKLFQGDEGVLVVYHDPDGKEDAVGISADSLIQGGRAGGSQRYTFKGENELMKALRKLTDKTATKIVFTKGNGELELGPNSNPLERGSRDTDDLATLKQRLQDKRNVELKDVELGLEGGKLGDADVVVVARPTSEFSDKAIASLREYLNPRGTAKKGKLIVLLDTQVRNRAMLKTGLEDMLKEFGVEISSGRILAVSQRPDEMGAFASERSPNPIARAFAASRSGWLFKQPRKVAPIKGAGSVYQADVILLAEGRQGVWDESNLTASPADLLNTYFGPGAAADKRPDLFRGLPVAVAVSEGKPKAGMPQDMAHQGLTDQVPRLVVFGNASWLTSQEIGRSENSFDLFDSCVTWLRGKSDLGPDVAEPKERPEFRLADKKLNQDPSMMRRLILLPLALIFLGVLALGGGIWVVRRR